MFVQRADELRVVGGSEDSARIAGEGAVPVDARRGHAGMYVFYEGPKLRCGGEAIVALSGAQRHKRQNGGNEAHHAPILCLQH